LGRTLALASCAGGLAAITALVASSSQFIQQRRLPLRQRLMNDVVVPASQLFTDSFEREGELLFGVTGDRASPAIRRFVWHGVLSLKRKELRHSQSVP